jgi:hypothetical protein
VQAARRVGYGTGPAVGGGGVRARQGMKEP